MKRYNTSMIFKAAWTMYKHANMISLFRPMTFGECLKASWGNRWMYED